ncbi:MAG TPA: ATP-dependent DNA helicase [Aeromicrobium sp.]|nr:ATP-dependent DNA helicase [Aeromicrobium sp.]
MPASTSPQYALRRRSGAPVAAPTLDASQQAVLEHFAQGPGGPLQVLAGPGTGKTTTLVELVIDRIEHGGLRPDQVLVLTFSRKAAQDIRTRIARRLARTTATTPAMTFHSFSYALLRAEQPAEAFAQPLRLLSAPEFDAAIADVLGGTDPMRWPAGLRDALRTRGMASELRAFLAAARAQGMDSLDIETVAASADRDDWRAVGEFFDELTSIAALANTIDHTDLIFHTVRLLADPVVRDRWRAKLKLVVVDEYQDTDPLQVQLLKALAGDGRDLVVVGDPYQSIYGFRGADVRGIVDFPHEFTTAGQPAPRLILSHTNRYGPTIAGAVRSIVENRGVLGPTDGPAFQALRNPTSRGADPGSVEVNTYVSPTAEAEHIALLLREAHLHAGVPWNDMAVLVRSGQHLGRLQRALTGSGVPVEVAGDELPVALEPSVRTLLAALHAADALSRGEQVGPDVATALLTGPLGNLDAAAVRRLGRVLRRHDAEHHERPRPSRVLIAEAVADPVFLETLDVTGPTAWAVESAAKLAKLLQRASHQIAAGEPAEQVLWTLWDGTSWPRRLQAEAEAASENALRANHDLDAVCVLFAEAARAEERDAHRSVAEVARSLEAQQIPADTLAQTGDAGEAVQLMTAHRAKGLEWPLVVVAAVQDGEWPDVRPRGSLLQGDRLSADGVLPPRSPWAAVAEERRLFYVACSRAKSRLVVTAVASGSDEGDQPSTFVVELADGLPDPQSRPHRTLSLRGAVARLRRIGESTTDPAVRDRVAAMLAQLASHRAGSAAHPDRWWGLAERTHADVAVRDPEAPLRLSGSQMNTLTHCVLQWFVSHEAKGERGTTSAQGFGSIVHAIAAEVVRAGLEPDAQQLASHLDAVWAELGYTPWVSTRERAEAIAALERFVAWHRANRREVLAAELEFDVTLDVDGRTVTLKGSMDRVERDTDGVHVVDFKTSKNAVPVKEAEEHPQLGVYQVAVAAGATETIAPGAPPAGAELVYLRLGKGAPTIRTQSAGTEMVLDQLRGAVRAIGEEDFTATMGDACGYCSFQRVCPAQEAGSFVVTEERS